MIPITKAGLESAADKLGATRPAPDPNHPAVQAIREGEAKTEAGVLWTARKTALRLTVECSQRLPYIELRGAADAVRASLPTEDWRVEAIDGRIVAFRRGTPLPRRTSDLIDDEPPLDEPQEPMPRDVGRSASWAVATLASDGPWLLAKKDGCVSLTLDEAATEREKVRAPQAARTALSGAGYAIAFVDDREHIYAGYLPAALDDECLKALRKSLKDLETRLYAREREVATERRIPWAPGQLAPESVVLATKTDVLGAALSEQLAVVTKHLHSAQVRWVESKLRGILPSKPGEVVSEVIA